MAKDERIDRRGRESAVNSAIGSLLSWVAGKDSVKRGLARSASAASNMTRKNNRNARPIRPTSW